MADVYTRIGYIKGATGATGTQGAKGDTGADGYSPTVTVIDITGGHRITITDADGAHSFDVMDGTGGGASSGLSGKKVVFLGDSIGYGEGNNDHSFVDIISEKGICSSVIKECHSSATIGPYEPWQQAAGYDCIAMIQTQSTNIANADIVYIEYGGNDSYALETGLITLGTSADASTVTSICGYARKAIENIRAINSTVEIVWLLPFIDDYSLGAIASYVNRDYRIAVTKAIINVCSSLDVTYFGLYSNLNPAKNGAHIINDAAGHPSEAGHEVIADTVIWGYPYLSGPYRPLRTITVTSSGTHDGVFASLILLINQGVDVEARYGGMIFRVKKIDSSSIVFSAVTASGTTETEYVLVITASATTLYSATRSLTSVPWDGGGGGDDPTPDPPTPSGDWETIYENNNVSIHANSDGATGYAWISQLASESIPEGSSWRITVDDVTNVETASYISQLNQVGIVYGESEIVFYQNSGGWIAYFPTKSSGTASIKIEKEVTT